MRIRSDSDRGAEYCRHHVQGPIHFGITDRDRVEGSLQRWHLPTGPVAIEDIIRFCIVDLGIEPLDAGWGDILKRSYDRFWTRHDAHDDA